MELRSCGKADGAATYAALQPQINAVLHTESRLTVGVDLSKGLSGFVRSADSFPRNYLDKIKKISTSRLDEIRSDTEVLNLSE